MFDACQLAWKINTAAMPAKNSAVSLPVCFSLSKKRLRSVISRSDTDIVTEYGLVVAKPQRSIQQKTAALKPTWLSFTFSLQ